MIEKQPNYQVKEELFDFKTFNKTSGNTGFLPSPRSKYHKHDQFLPESVGRNQPSIFSPSMNQSHHLKPNFMLKSIDFDQRKIKQDPEKSSFSPLRKDQRLKLDAIVSQLNNSIVEDEAITYGDKSSMVKEQKNGDEDSKIGGWNLTSQSRSREPRYQDEFQKSNEKKDSPQEKDKQANLPEEKKSVFTGAQILPEKSQQKDRKYSPELRYFNEHIRQSRTVNVSQMGSEETNEEKRNSPRQLGHKKHYIKKMNSKPKQKKDQHKELTQKFQFQINTFIGKFGDSNQDIRQKFVTDRHIFNNTTASLSTKHSPLGTKNNLDAKSKNAEVVRTKNSSVNYEIGSQSTIGNSQFQTSKGQSLIISPKAEETGTISKIREKRDSCVYSGNSSTVTQNSRQSYRDNKFITDSTPIQIMSVTNQHEGMKGKNGKVTSKINFIDNQTSIPNATSTTKSIGYSPKKNKNSKGKYNLNQKNSSHSSSKRMKQVNQSLNVKKLGNLNINSYENIGNLDQEIIQIEDPTKQNKKHIPTNRELFEKRNKRKVNGTLDFDKINNQQSRMALPALMKGTDIEDKNLPEHCYRLPPGFKFTSDDKFTNIDMVRTRLRKSMIDHINFEPMLGAAEGQKYFGQVYKQNQSVFVSVSNPKDKNQLLKITRPDSWVDPNEIDPIRDPEVAATRHYDYKGYVAYTKPEAIVKQPKELTRQDEEDRERDLLTFILKYENFCKIQSTSGQIIRNDGQEIIFEEQKTDEQFAQDKFLNMEFESLKPKNMYKVFESQLRQTDTGEFQIDLTRSSEIEREIRDSNLLDKYNNPNYNGSLKALITQINNKFASGWEIDYTQINKILKAAKDFEDSLRKGKKKTSDDLEPVKTNFRDAQKIKEEQRADEEEAGKFADIKLIRKMFKEGIQVQNLGESELAQQAVVNSMSLIEMQCIKDKAKVRIREIEKNERIAQLQKQKMDVYAKNTRNFFSEYHASQYFSDDDDENMTLKERHAKNKEKAKQREAEKEKKAGLTYMQIFQQEKIAEYNRRQKMFNQVKFATRAMRSSSKQSYNKQGSIDSSDSQKKVSMSEVISENSRFLANKKRRTLRDPGSFRLSKNRDRSSSIASSVSQAGMSPSMRDKIQQLRVKASGNSNSPSIRGKSPSRKSKSPVSKKRSYSNSKLKSPSRLVSVQNIDQDSQANDYFNKDNMKSNVGYTGTTPVSSQKTSQESISLGSQEKRGQRIGDLIHQSHEIQQGEIKDTLEDIMERSDQNVSKRNSTQKLLVLNTNYNFEVAQKESNRPLLENLLASSFATPQEKASSKILYFPNQTGDNFAKNCDFEEFDEESAMPSPQTKNNLQIDPGFSADLGYTGNTPISSLATTSQDVQSSVFPANKDNETEAEFHQMMNLIPYQSQSVSVSESQYVPNTMRNPNEIKETRAVQARNEAIILREMQIDDLFFVLRLGISRVDQDRKEKEMIKQYEKKPDQSKSIARENLLRNSLSHDYQNKLEKAHVFIKPKQLQVKAQAVSQLHTKNENKRYLDQHGQDRLEPISIKHYNKKTVNVSKKQLFEQVSPDDFLSLKCQLNSEYHKEAQERFKQDVSDMGISTDIVKNKSINHFKNKVRQEDESQAFQKYSKLELAGLENQKRIGFEFNFKTLAMEQVKDTVKQVQIKSDTHDSSDHYMLSQKSSSMFQPTQLIEYAEFDHGTKQENEKPTELHSQIFDDEKSLQVEDKSEEEAVLDDGLIVADPIAKLNTVSSFKTVKQSISSIPTEQTPEQSPMDTKYVLETIKTKKKVGFERSDSDSNTPDVIYTVPDSVIIDERHDSKPQLKPINMKQVIQDDNDLNMISLESQSVTSTAHSMISRKIQSNPKKEAREKKLKEMKKKQQQESLKFRNLVRENCEVALNPEKIKQMKQKWKSVGSRCNTNLQALKQPRKEKENGEQEDCKKDDFQNNVKRSDQNRKNVTFIMRTLENQYQNKGLNMKDDELLKIGQNSNAIKKEISELVNGIDNFQYLNSKVNKPELVASDDIKELLPQISDIIKQNQERDDFDHENFLSKQVARTFQQTNYDNSVKVKHFQKRPKIWRPNKLRLNLKIFDDPKD